MKDKFKDSHPLFVSDLDGTLLGSDSRISAHSGRILSELTRSGVMITVATARTPATVDILLRGSGLCLPVIVMTGAALWDPTRKRYISCEQIEIPVAEEILHIMSASGLRPFVYRLGTDGILHTYHNGPMSASERSFAAERARLPLKRMHIDHPDGGVMKDGTVLFFAMGPREVVYACAELLGSVSGCSVSAYNDIFNSSTGHIEVFAAGVSKATALHKLAGLLQATSVTVFGDNLNDIPMMEAADMAVAVANAQEEVKSIADIIIGANTEDAVANYIKEVSGL